MNDNNINFRIPSNIISSHWKICLTSTPIFSIDVIVYRKNLGILMGKRLNEPAKEKFFVPGGRVYKGETRSNAFQRIVFTETGISSSFSQTIFLGIFEHFYDNSVFIESEIKTHNINELIFLELSDSDPSVHLQTDNQHSFFKWIDLKNYAEDEIHSYALDYIDVVNTYLSSLK